MKFLRGRNLLFVSGAPWHYVFQPVATLYAGALAAANRVTWFNPPQRNPLRFVRDNRRFGGRRNGVRVYTPFCTTPQYGALSALDQKLLIAQAKMVGGASDSKDQVIWSNCYPNPELAARFKRAYYIYWPGDSFDPGAELDRLKSCNLVMPLTEEKTAAVAARFPGKAMLSTTGCDFHSFRAAEYAMRGHVEKKFAGLRRPIAGYAGHISSHRIDFGLVEHLCHSMPEVTFVFAGAQDGRAETADAVARLARTCPNALLLGEFSYGDLPYLIKHFTAGIIPYQLNDFNLGTNPNKLYEYFAMGKPVISVALPSLRKFAPRVALAQSKEEFASRLAACLTEQPAEGAKAERIAIAREYSPEEALKRIDAFIVGQMATPITVGHGIRA